MDADEIVDRRLIRRKLSFWRVVAFVALVVAVLAGINAMTGGLFRNNAPHIARIGISGFIDGNRGQLELLEALAEDGSVRGVIVAIDSPGGTTAGGEALYEALRDLADAKPTVATMGTVAASAAYMAAVATDHVVARRSSLTGSIGVIFEYPEIGDLLDMLGVNVESVTSGPLKAEPSLFEPASPEGIAMIEGLVQDSYRWFVSVVAERRGLTVEATTALADGRVYTGNQALAAELVDELGGEEVAIAWLESRGVAADLPVHDWAPARSGGFLPFSEAAIRLFARLIGQDADGIALLALEQILPERLRLDGLLSVWQGPIDRPE